MVIQYQSSMVGKIAARQCAYSPATSASSRQPRNSTVGPARWRKVSCSGPEPTTFNVKPSSFARERAFYFKFQFKDIPQLQFERGDSRP